MVPAAMNFMADFPFVLFTERQRWVFVVGTECRGEALPLARKKMRTWPIATRPMLLGTPRGQEFHWEYLAGLVDRRGHATRPVPSDWAQSVVPRPEAWAPPRVR
jgi:hypothetical protein